jgi:hypothetical protein
MRLLVCGGRRFWNANLVNRVLDEIHAATPVSLVIHGLASGADTLAGAWADRNHIPVEGYRAAWKQLGKPAGAIRNAIMLREGKPDLVVAFPGNKGTADMIKQTLAAKVHLKIIDKWGGFKPL